MNYEVSHVYLDGEVGKEQLQGIKIYKNIKKENDTSSLMIDDYSLKHGGVSLINPNDIINFYNEHINLSSISYESEFTHIAKIFESMFKIKKERFRKDNKHVIFMIINNNKIKLRDEYDSGLIKYSCPSLSASFHLFRAGMIGDNKTLSQKNKIGSILPKEYIFIEKQVKAILDSLNCSNEYIFY